MNKNVGLCRVLGDLIKGLKCCEVISVASLSLVLSLLVYCTNKFSLEELKSVVYTLLPNLIGFSLTIYVVLFGLSSLIIERLKEKSDDRKIPFEIIAPRDPFYSKDNMENIKESIQQIKEGKIVQKTMEELEAMESE